MKPASIIGLFAGGIETFVAADGRPLRTAIRKSARSHVRVESAGVVGDASADPEYRSPDRAVHLFADADYRAIEAAIGVRLPRPCFGENITTLSLSDNTVQVGDVWRIGTAVLRVTMPTERCRTIGRSSGLPKILKAMQSLEICGHYAAVIEPGEMAIGARIERVDRSDGSWTIRQLHRFMYKQINDDDRYADVMAQTALSLEWKQRIDVMRGRANRGEPLSSNLVDI